MHGGGGRTILVTRWLADLGLLASSRPHWKPITKNKKKRNKMVGVWGMNGI